MSTLVPAGARRLLACAALFASLFLLAFEDRSSAAALDLETLDGPTAVAMMESGALTSVELTQAYIDRIEALNQAGPGLNAVSQLNKDALKEARRYDELRAEGKVLGPAMGLPILLKDLIDVKGMYTSAGNFSLRDSFPESDSGVAKKLRENGVVILGKLGLSEYANSFGSQPSGFSNLTGQVLHATDTDLNPSGSSSGTGSAGAAALSMLTIGTETSGSITSPSRAEGLVGLRPTVGLVPGYGVAPIRASQDTAGPMDRTVANAALTLASIAGPDPFDAAYYKRYYEEGGLDVDDIVPPQPSPLPNYLDALDPNYVKGMRIGYFEETAEVLAAKQALEDAGATLVKTTFINTDELPELSGAGEQHLDIDMYYERLGPNAPINSLAEEIADNVANAHEALKFGNNSHVNASKIAYGPGTPWEAEFKTKLPIRKEKAWQGIERMLNNNTPGDPSDDFAAILGTANTGPAPNGPLAGWPAITVPVGYSATHRRPVGVSFSGAAYSELDLLGIAYVLEQQTKKVKPASLVNPSMYRCADTVPAPAFAERGDCNPELEETLALAGGAVPELPFALEMESAQGLQSRMAAGTLTASDLTKAYLARIAVANAAGPAIQAVREVNPKAVAEAQALDAERAKAGPRGPLHGVPVILDDGIDAVGLPSTGGSIALQGATPEESSRVVAKLKAAGAIVLGKANVSELNGLFSATMPEGYSSLGGQVLLPSDTDKTVAGSAAGSAAATASGMAALAVGMETSPDTAQLIAPAAAAGVVALKPTVGRVSRAGVMPVAKSQDSPGPIAKTVYDAALTLQTIAGLDFKDPATTGTPPVPDYLSGLTTAALTGKRIGVVAGAAAPYPEAVKAITDLGATAVTKTIGTAAPNQVLTREFKRDLNAYLGGLSGTPTGSLAEIVAYNEDHKAEGLKYQQGQLLEADAANLNDPTTKAAYEADLAAGKAADKATIDALLDNGTEGDTSDDLDLIAVPQGNALVAIADRAGYPVLTVPAGYGTGSAGRNPVGIVFVAAAFDEAELLAGGYAFEQATDWREIGPDYDPSTEVFKPLIGGSGAPSYTNPSMWRCVPLSQFYAPHHCRPGSVDPLPAVAPEPGKPDTPVPPAGKAKLTLKVTPKLRVVGPARAQVSYKVTVANVGDASAGKLRLCASAPKARLSRLGKKCVSTELVASGALVRSFQFKLKPAAVGKQTKLTFSVGGKSTKAQLKVKAA